MSTNSITAVSDALKYINGAEVSEEEESIVSDVKSSVCSPINLLFGLSEASGGLKNATGATKLFKDTTNEAGETVKSVFSLLKSGTALEGVDASTSFSSQLSSTIEDITSKATAKTAAKSSGKISKFFSSIGTKISEVATKIPGVSTLASKISGASSWFSGTTFGKVLKGTGAIGMMAISGVIGLFTEVIPAFQQGGVKSGLKQLGKTAVNTVANGLGWAGGTVAGGAIGAAIGSLFGPVGTVVGGAIGKFMGGMVGSTVLSGVATKITGKSETEILEDEQYEEAAVQVASDSEAMSELNTLVYQQVQAEIEAGTADEDTEIMASYLNSGAFSTSSTSSYATSSGTTTSSTAQSAAEDASYWSEIAQKIASGDTSVYNISDEDLEAKFNSSSSSSSSTSTSTSASEVIDYFG